LSNRIENYAMIGNGRSAALVGIDGSIDWLCLPTFSDAACFAALLGTFDNGCWSIAPVGDVRPARRYRGDTMVLETTFTAADGSAAMLVDFMLRPDPEHDCPEISVVRIVRGVRGTVALRSDLSLRFNYGKSYPWVRQVDATTVTATAGHETVVVRAGAAGAAGPAAM
jgi:GH15 family glucan-1,4-alpha-glucosidase